MLHLQSNIPEEYKLAVAELEKDMQSQSTPLSMEVVRKVLKSRFEPISNYSDISEDEKPFSAWAKKQFKGICQKFASMAILPTIA